MSHNLQSTQGLGVERFDVTLMYSLQGLGVERFVVTLMYSLQGLGVERFVVTLLQIASIDNQTFCIQ